MSVTDKQPPTGMQVQRQVERILAERIPDGWSLSARRSEAIGRYRVDLRVETASAAGVSAILAVGIKRTLEPRDGFQAVERISRITGGALPRAVPVVAAAYLSPRVRVLLRAGGVGYVDTTGNVRIEISVPGLFVSTDGADRDPLAKGSQAPVPAGSGRRPSHEGHHRHTSSIRRSRAGSVDWRVGTDAVPGAGPARS